MDRPKLRYQILYASIVIATLLLARVLHASAHQELIPMQATAYCSGTTTASGKPVRYGMCASKPEWIGCMAVVYERDKYGFIGKHIGTYDIEDTGGKAIRKGKVIDIYIPSYDDCIKFGRKNVYVQIIKGKG